MNTDLFLQRHGLDGNPFRGEEARQDAVFDRVEADFRHPDFSKILGDLAHPASAVVFGERGSGKTALRMQFETVLSVSNRDDSGSRTLVVAHDEFNPMLAAIRQQMDGGVDDAVLESVSVSDHLDAILAKAVPLLVDAIVGGKAEDETVFGAKAVARRTMRTANLDDRNDLLRLQMLYDRSSSGVIVGDRSKRLRRALRLRGRSRVGLASSVTAAMLVFATAWSVVVLLGRVRADWIGWAPAGLFLFAALIAAGAGIRSSHRLRRTAAGARQRLRTLDRGGDGFIASLRQASPADLGDAIPPAAPAGEEWRIARMEDLVRILGILGVQGIVVLIDRVDEPVMVRGDPGRMRSLVWPLLRNKVLQMPGVGLKFLLPLELRELLNRESSDFFRQARLDKQNLVEKLTWSGATLFDLCNARMKACATAEASPGLMKLFHKDVDRREVVDALDQMQQPRDAFKFLYALVQEHCSNLVELDEDPGIARPTLDLVRKRHVERREEVLRGLRAG
ncbi:MAG: hypothetical protein O3A31_02180 [Planctomycetota bacterium]|nr:hypothetical protein [Planctomycetota bacterium]